MACVITRCSGTTFRKSVLASALVPALLVAGGARADTVSIIEQEGGETNQAEIVQIETINAYGYILQDGNLNNASILQEGPLGSGLMSASITQYGTANEALLDQSTSIDTASAEITQGGTQNYAEGYQFNSEQVSLLMEQSGEGNSATIYQTMFVGAADITQVGMTNFASIDQSGGNVRLRASAYQEGSTNTLVVVQESNSGGGIDGEVYTHQIGDNNITDVYQTNFGASSSIEAVVTTQGDSNIMNVSHQASDASVTLTYVGDGNTAGVYQTGERLHATISSHSSDYNTDTIAEDGTAIDVSVERVATDNSMTQVVFDNSLDSSAEILQTGSDAVSAEIFHSGDWQSHSAIEQNSASMTNAYVSNDGTWNSNASISQTGVSTSSATISQYHNGVDGQDLIATIYQSNGVDLLAAIEQTNVGNEAHIIQMNTSGVEAYILQVGVDNYAEITQTGGSDSGNVTTITQNGEGYSSSVSQAGADNMATIVQM